MLMDFLFNQIADTLILYLLKRKKFPERNTAGVMLGGCSASLSFCFWKYFICEWGTWIRGPAAILFISAVIVLTFRIKSLFQLISSFIYVCLCTCMTGGAVIALRQISKSLSIFAGQSSAGHLNSLWVSLLVFAASWIYAVFSYDRKQSGKTTADYYQVEIHRGSVRVSCIGLYDSANLLTSQITGEGICVLDEKTGSRLLTREETVCDIMHADEIPTGLYPIRYHCVSEKEGTMKGILADRIIVKRAGKEYVHKKGMIGICKGSLSNDRRFEALLPEDIFDRINPIE